MGAAPTIPWAAAAGATGTVRAAGGAAGGAGAVEVDIPKPRGGSHLRKYWWSSWQDAKIQDLPGTWPFRISTWDWNNLCDPKVFTHYILDSLFCNQVAGAVKFTSLPQFGFFHCESLLQNTMHPQAMHDIPKIMFQMSFEELEKFLYKVN